MSRLHDNSPMCSRLPKPVNAGFTLIEMLVVMVIMVLTTGLLTEGLSTTWRSFERLSARALITSSAQLPILWFEQSLAGALLYHPAKALVRGEPQTFEFVTAASPDDGRHIPQTLIWTISFLSQGNQKGQWLLSFKSEMADRAIAVKHFTVQPMFEYWDGQQWLMKFNPADGRLPLAARIIVAQQVWAMAKPGRPALADVPGEMGQFGTYVF